MSVNRPLVQSFYSSPTTFIGEPFYGVALFGDNTLHSEFYSVRAPTVFSSEKEIGVLSFRDDAPLVGFGRGSSPLMSGVLNNPRVLR